LRVSTDRTGRFGLSGLVGVAGIAGLVTAGGPYAGGSARFGHADVGFGYVGAKVNPVLSSLGTQVWLTPTVGFATAGKRWRVGGEGTWFLPLAMPSIYAGIGGQIYMTRRFGPSSAR